MRLQCPFDMVLVFDSLNIVNKTHIVLNLTWQPQSRRKPVKAFALYNHLHDLHRRFGEWQREFTLMRFPVHQLLLAVKLCKQMRFQQSNMAYVNHRPGLDIGNFPDINHPIGDNIRSRRRQMTTDACPDSVNRLPDIDRNIVQITKRIYTYLIREVGQCLGPEKFRVHVQAATRLAWAASNGSNKCCFRCLTTGTATPSPANL